ncbi:MAG: cadherin repeat domain-containing protein [Bacteroidales bacterium]|nr:cadherin repeat domain-containing protein [Bacteroidales bacterium]
MKPPSFALVVKVQDNGTGSLSAQATITVNLTNVNEVPAIGNQSFSIAENSANGTNVGTVAASDPDAGQILTYTILSGNTSGAFNINATSGALTVANSAALNYETTPTFSLVVKVQDNGTGTLSSQATVTINLTNGNDAPVITNQTFSIAENSANGTNVGTVIATDPDAGQTLTYSILSGNTAGAFTINSTSGVLTVANGTALNFETTPTFALVVKVQDNGTGSLSAQATITVNLTNVNEVPAIGNQTFSIAENSANGTNVGTVAASDPDAGQTLAYSILSGNTSGAFAISTTTGTITVANSTILNFESNPSFSLVVKVQDNGSGTLSAQATITINLSNVNEAPVINNQAFSIIENSANGTNVGTVLASDPDAGQTLSYSILSGNTSNAFNINSITGVITVANSSALNFETTPSYSLVIKVQDNGAGLLNSQAIITINLTDANDLPVITNQSFSVAENASNGTNIGTIMASDPDAGQILTYFILSGNTSNAFAINAITGQLTVANSTVLNFETTPLFSLLVKVQDNGTVSFSS